MRIRALLGPLLSLFAAGTVFGQREVVVSLDAEEVVMQLKGYLK